MTETSSNASGAPADPSRRNVIVLALSLALVLQEGLEIPLLRRVLASACSAARAAGVEVVTGDTKVLPHDDMDGMIINTAGVGTVSERAELGFDRIRTGDKIVLSGPLGEHGLAVMSLREGLSFSSDLLSDCACIHGLTATLLERLGFAVRFMRDPTRGGLASVLVEISKACRRDIEIEERAIPVNRAALAAAEMLGLDLLTVANEGKLVAVVAAEAEVIGTVGESCPSARGPLVEMITTVGGRRVVQMPYGQELPRIC